MLDGKKRRIGILCVPVHAAYAQGKKSEQANKRHRKSESKKWHLTEIKKTNEKVTREKNDPFVRWNNKCECVLQRVKRREEKKKYNIVKCLWVAFTVRCAHSHIIARHSLSSSYCHSRVYSISMYIVECIAMCEKSKRVQCSYIYMRHTAPAYTTPNSLCLPYTKRPQVYHSLCYLFHQYIGPSTGSDAQYVYKYMRLFVTPCVCVREWVCVKCRNAADEPNLSETIITQFSHNLEWDPIHSNTAHQSRREIQTIFFLLKHFSLSFNKFK